MHDKLCPLVKSVPIAAALLRKEREAVEEHARDDDESRKRFSSRNKRQVTSGMVSAARSVGVVLVMQLGLAAGFTVAPSMARFEGGMALARHISLRVCGSPEPNVCDVYVHAVGSDRLWWVGKSCARGGVGGVDGAALAVVLQKQLVLENAKILQPLELGQAEELEVWCAPLGGELTSAQRKEDGMHPLTTLRPTAFRWNKRGGGERRCGGGGSAGDVRCRVFATSRGRGRVNRRQLALRASKG